MAVFVQKTINENTILDQNWGSFCSNRAMISAYVNQDPHSKLNH